MGKRLLRNTEWAVLIVSILLFVIGSIALFSAYNSNCITSWGIIYRTDKWS